MNAIVTPAYQCVLASAGTGKTFRLSNRYLQLVRRGADVGSILATTFTRAAAAEIQRRVVLRLVDAAQDAAARAELGDFTGGEDLTRADVLRMLREICTNLHRLQIRTIDSFYNAIVNGFALELNVPAGYLLAEETDVAALRGEALELLFHHHGDEIAGLLRSLTEHAEVGVHQTVDDIVDRWHDLWLDATDDAWAWVPDLPVDPDPEAMLNAFESASIEHFARERGVTLALARAGNWDGVFAKGLPKKIQDKDLTFRKREIDAATLALYAPLMDHGRACIAQNLRSRLAAIRALVERYDEYLGDVKRRRRMLAFGDLAVLLRRANVEGRLDEIRYRIDSTVDHLELDEFQDTSPMQWDLLRAVSEELIMAEDARPTSLFCVGDVKQSIYGWRGACPEILESVPALLADDELGTGPVVSDTLEQSYRSSQVVIDAVNEVFAAVSGGRVEAVPPDVAARWTFKAHSTARTKLPGLVELCVLESADDSTKRMWQRMDETARIVQEIYDGSPPGRTIAVLVRTNRQVGRMLYALGPARARLPVAGYGGSELTDTAVATVLLDLLHLADHPGDTRCAFNVATSPLGVIVGLTEWSDSAQRRAVGLEVRRRFVDDGAARTIARWVRELAPSVNTYEYRRLHRLVDVAAQCEAVGADRPRDVRVRAEKMKVAENLPAPIQVMTVHQSKGLEFDAVVLPELEDPLNRTPRIASQRADEIGPVNRACPWQKNERVATIPEVRALHQATRAREVREALCTLYVAMTRAKQGLYLIAQGDFSGYSRKSHAGIVRGTLAADDRSTGVVYRKGDPDWFRAVHDVCDAAGAGRSAVIDASVTFVRPPRGVDRPRAAVAASSIGRIAERESLAHRLTMPPASAREIGVAVHALFERIAWLEGDEPERRALLGVARAAAPRLGRAEAEEAVRLFIEAVQDPRLRGLLTRPVGGTLFEPEEADVYREFPYARLVEGGAVERGVIDRLIVRGDGVRAVSAEIIDFKTDVLDDGEETTHAERHRAQLMVYRDVVAELFSLEPDAITMHLAFVRTGAVVDLGEVVRKA